VMATVFVSDDEAYIEQMGNKMDMPEEMAADMRNGFDIVSEITLKDSETIEVTGMEDVDGEKAYAVTNKGASSTSTSYYSVETGLKLKKVSTSEMMGQTQTQEQTFGSYKNFGGLQLPTTSSMPMGPQAIDVTIEAVEINGAAVSAE
jgi:zinc protease